MASNKSDTEKHKDIPYSSYALYLYDKERSATAKVVVASEDNIPGKAEEEIFGIKLISSSLSPEHECLLQLFLIRRIKRGAIYSQTGNFSGMDFSLTENPSSPAVCFYVLLQCGTSEQVLICLLTDTETNLEVFRPELTRYCEALAPTIPIDKAAELPKPLIATLSTWHTECIYYVSRVVRAMGHDVASLLQLAQQNGKIEGADNVSTRAVTDVQRFLSACAVAEYVGTTVSDDASGEPPAMLKLGDAEGRLTVDGVECNQYCREWAQHLLDLGEDCEPWRIRKILEAFKLKTIKDMNTLKRLLKQAETDHYSLYRAYTFLQTSGNSDILLKQVQIEGGSASDVIKVLEEHLDKTVTRNNCGAAAN